MNRWGQASSIFVMLGNNSGFKIKLKEDVFSILPYKSLGDAYDEICNLYRRILIVIRHNVAALLTPQ